MAKISLQNAEFTEMSNEANVMQRFAILPYGGAYRLQGREWEKVEGSDNVYDADDLQAHIFDLRKAYLETEKVLNPNK